MVATKKTAAPRTPRPPQESEADIRARLAAELRAEIEAELRAEAEEKERQAQEIREAAGEAKPVTGQEIDGDPEVPGSVTIHFVTDGHTALGKVWYTGETLTVNPDTTEWEASMVNLYKGSSEKIMFALMDEDQQIRKWGKRIFRPGPWPGINFDAINDPDLSDAERESLRAAARLHESRYGALAR